MFGCFWGGGIASVFWGRWCRGKTLLVLRSGGVWDWLVFGMGCLTGAMLRHMFVEGPRRTVVTVLGDEKLLKSFSEELLVAETVFGSEDLLGWWDRSKVAPEPEFEAERAAGEVALDLLLARKEYETAAKLTSDGWESRQAGDIVAGAGQIAAITGSFFVPWGKGGRLITGGLRGAGGGTMGRFVAGEALEGVSARVEPMRGLGPVENLDREALGVIDEAMDTLARRGVEVTDADAFRTGFAGLGEGGRGGGFTFVPHTGQSFFDRGYGTAIAKGYTLQIPKSQFSALDVGQYLNYRPVGTRFTVAEILARDPRNAIGGWLEVPDAKSSIPIMREEHVWLDISRVVKTESEALSIAGALNDRAIIDFRKAVRTDFKETDIIVPESYKTGGARHVPDAVEDFSEPSLFRDAPTRGQAVEEVPVALVLPFRDKARSGRRVNELADDIKRRGIKEPLVLEIGENGRGLLTDGNHRLAAAIEAGLQTVPVRTFIRKSIDGGAPVQVGSGARQGYMLAPSDATGGELSPLVPRSIFTGGSFTADLSGVQARELAERMAARHMESPSGLAAVDPEEIAAVLRELPEFEDFVRLYRNEVVIGTKPHWGMKETTLDRAKMESGRKDQLLRFAQMAGLDAPKWSGGSKADFSFLAAINGTEKEFLREASLNIATRLRNLSVFISDDIYQPQFYVEFNRIIRSVTDQTGLPEEVLSSALAAASSQAAPYQEVLRLVRVLPLVEYSNGAARVVPGGKELLGTDNFAKQALDGLVDTINNPDFLTVKPFGHAAKTSSYAYARIDPMYKSVYVADTVDNLGQHLIRGGSASTDDAAKTSIVNQMAGRTLANMYDVSPGAVQEAVWSHIRVVRDGMSPTGLKAIGPSFSGPQGNVEDLLVEAVKKMDPKALRLAQQNRDTFYQQVKAGEVPAWIWDSARDRPVISSVQYLIPSDQRGRANFRAARLQGSMLEVVRSISPAMQAKFLSLAAVLGISAAVLVEALGEGSSDIPGYAIGAPDA